MPCLFHTGNNHPIIWWNLCPTKRSFISESLLALLTENDIVDLSNIFATLFAASSIFSWDHGVICRVLKTAGGYYLNILLTKFYQWWSIIFSSFSWPSSIQFSELFLFPILTLKSPVIMVRYVDNLFISFGSLYKTLYNCYILFVNFLTLSEEVAEKLMILMICLAFTFFILFSEWNFSRFFHLANLNAWVSSC